MTNGLPNSTKPLAATPAARVFLDTEFVETDGQYAFISVGLVSGQGHEFYAELPVAEADKLLAKHPNDFVRTSVVRQLGAVQGVLWSELPMHLAQWLEGLGTASVEVVYDFSADFLLIEQMQARLGRMLGVTLIPSHVGYLLEDVDGESAATHCWRALASVRGIDRHHALADAYALRARFETVHWHVERVEPKVVELHATVSILIPEFCLVHAETPDGIRLSIGENTPGVAWRSLEVGQLLRCVAEVGGATRVLSAELVDPSGTPDKAD